MDNTWGKCGIFDLKMMINDTLISHFSFEEFSFDESISINNHIDYELSKTKNRRIHKSFREANDSLSIYSKMVNNGIYFFKKNTRYKIDFLVADANKNISKLRVSAKGNEVEKHFPSAHYDVFMDYDKENIFKQNDLEVKFPINSFYSELPFTYSVKPSSHFLSDIHYINNENVPVNKYYTLSIKPKSIPKGKSEKLFIARINKTGSISYEGGVYFDSTLKTKTRYFGNFAVDIDTIPPVIKAKTNFKLKSLSGQKSIRFTITDALSGIGSYEGFIDDKWVLFKFDAKNNLLYYDFDRKRLIPNKKHKLLLKVSDHLKNESTFTNHFFW
jgi:hypothetical protein